MMKDIHNHKLALASLGNVIDYLEKLLIADRTVPIAEYHKYSHNYVDEDGKILEFLLHPIQILEYLLIYQIYRRAYEGTH